MTSRGHGPASVAGLSIVALTAGCSVVADTPREPPIAEQTAAIVGGTASPASDDFIVFIGRVGSTKRCSGVLVAPNLVATAKHCANEAADTTNISFCDATGEPAIESTGGFIVAPYPLNEFAILTGVDAAKRFFDGEPAAAGVARIVDDGSRMLCSRDFAFLVLDRALESVPLAKVRLGYPTPGSALSVAGWGEIEDKIRPAIRIRRDNVLVQRVGPSAAIPGATGTLGPRTFETGPAGCVGDSGSPAFDAQTNAVLGVLARAIYVQPDDAVRCTAESVVNTYMTLADHGPVLREAFAAANALPWLEGRDAPGYLSFGEACISSAQCEGALCLGATQTESGTCNTDCKSGGRTCPTGLVCSERGACEPPVVEESDAGPTPTLTPVRPSSCSAAPATTGNACAALAFVSGCLTLVTRLRRKRSVLAVGTRRSS